MDWPIQEIARLSGTTSRTRRHYDWISTSWPGKHPNAQQFVGLGEMYVADDRFGANYGGVEGASFVRDAMKAYAERNLR
ncbi:TipAS antibiotic-recognition domain-containing protein [Glaciihabitans sp. UYNi722]|uniref:MerR family transcriptional regulator n=1 Tax=Glaciihabitans sp. UYNi722 TaxID=3156344 RepID=UPI003397C629